MARELANLARSKKITCSILSIMKICLVDLLLSSNRAFWLKKIRILEKIELPILDLVCLFQSSGD
jgi:hypothetical protein